MKKLTLTIIFASLFIQIGHCQTKQKPNLAKNDKQFDNGSKIIIPVLSNELVNNLELLGRVWGFLKYHHSEVAKGNYNWDYELFRILPSYLNVKNNQERDNTTLLN